MQVVCTGISHKTAPVALRERIAMDDEAALAAVTDLRSRYPDCEFVVVSTCNRTELYAARPRGGHPRTDELLRWLADRTGAPADELGVAAYTKEDERAIDHLLRVAGGLDSMVLGEEQILGQVRAAYETAQQAGSVGGVLHPVFQAALATGKRLRSETSIGTGRTSVASVAVDFARHLFTDFTDKTLLTIGAGKMVDLTLRHFAEMGVGRTLVCNRSADKAAALAERFTATAVGFDGLDEHLVAADVVVSSTGAHEPIVTAARFRGLLKRRRFRPVFIIDIAVPRDFEAGVGELTNVYLYNLDDLQRAISEQMTTRGGELAACEAIVAECAAAVHRAIATHDVADLIRELRRRLQTIGEQETQRTLNKIGAAAADRDAIERALAEHTHRVINKVLHKPLTSLHNGSSTDAALHAAALRRVFELEENG